MNKPNLPDPAHPKPNVCRPQTYSAVREYYYDVATQLDALWHDINTGVFGEAAKTGKFYQYIFRIKQEIPKPGDSV
jgi:hypothetical protein